MEIKISWMVRRDLPALLPIEEEGGPFFERWEERDFISNLRNRNIIGMVAEERQEDGAEKIVGFMVYRLEPDHIHVLKLSVCPLHRRKGVGRCMVNKLISKLSHERRSRVVVDIDERNLQAQLFLKKQGFLCTQMLRGADGDEYCMEHRLQPLKTIPVDAERVHLPVNRIKKFGAV